MNTLRISHIKYQFYNHFYVILPFLINNFKIRTKFTVCKMTAIKAVNWVLKVCNISSGYILLDKYLQHKTRI